VAGTILGAFAGAGTFKDWPVMDAALGFILPALFLALLLSILRRDMVLVVMTAVVVTFGMSHVFSTAIALLLGMVGGGLVGVFARGGPAHDPD
jgi:predicted branched-subunit amino acid permease